LITLKFEFFFERSWLVRQDPDGRFLVEEKEAKKRGVGGSSVSSASAGVYGLCGLYLLGGSKGAEDSIC